MDDITEINILEQDGPRFPFEVHFKGRNSPWELNVYSEVNINIFVKAILRLQLLLQGDRRYWKEALQMHPDSVIQYPPQSSVQKDIPTTPSAENVGQEQDGIVYERIIDALKGALDLQQIDVFTQKLKHGTAAPIAPPRKMTLAPPQGIYAYFSYTVCVYTSLT